MVAATQPKTSDLARVGPLLAADRPDALRGQPGRHRLPNLDRVQSTAAPEPRPGRGSARSCVFPRPPVGGWVGQHREGQDGAPAKRKRDKPHQVHSTTQQPRTSLQKFARRNGQP